MFLVENGEIHSNYDYKIFTTAEGKTFLYKLFNNDNDLETYLKEIYAGDNQKLHRICYDLDKMLDYNIIKFKKYDSYKPLANQTSSGKVMLYFDSLVLTDEMADILKNNK